MVSEPISVNEWRAQQAAKRPRAPAAVLPSLRGRLVETWDGRRLEVTWPLEAPLPALVNLHVHHRVKAKLVKAQRALVALALGRWRRELAAMRLPVAVTLTRVGPRRLDDDNAHSAVKAARDEVTVHLGLTSDASPRVRWTVAQETGEPALRVAIEPLYGARS